MKKFLLLLIRFYKKIISPLKSPCCKYYPTCSEYAVQAIEKHGALKGSVLAAWRILRCNPWSLGGIDNVPENFSLYTLNRRYGKGNTVPPDKKENTQQ